jgi:hypothetical protein
MQLHTASPQGGEINLGKNRKVVTARGKQANGVFLKQIDTTGQSGNYFGRFCTTSQVFYPLAHLQAV